MGAEFYLSTCTYFCTGIAYNYMVETIIISTVVVKGLTYKLCKCVWPWLCVVNLPYYVCMLYWNCILKNSWGRQFIGIYSSSKRVNM